MNSAGYWMASTGGLLLGRRTCEDFYAVWSKRTDNPFMVVMATCEPAHPAGSQTVQVHFV